MASLVRAHAYAPLSELIQAEISMKMSFCLVSVLMILIPGCPNSPPDQALGNGDFVLEPNANGIPEQLQLKFEVVAASLVGRITAAHLHRSTSGEVGPVVYDITNFGSETDGLTGVWPLTDQDLADLYAGRIYVDIHTAIHPEGEIRGQIVQICLTGTDETGEVLTEKPPCFHAYLTRESVVVP